MTIDQLREILEVWQEGGSKERLIKELICLLEYLDNAQEIEAEIEALKKGVQALIDIDVDLMNIEREMQDIEKEVKALMAEVSSMIE
jgi:hypothetical protein